MADRKAKDWIVIHPDSTREEVFNMVKYCKDNKHLNLNSNSMTAVARGKRNHHKGFKVKVKIPDQNSSPTSGK